MIFFGKKSKQLGTKLVESVCAHCAQNVAHVLSGSQSYAHIYWVPVIPLRKRVMAICSHCRVVTDREGMPHALAIAASEFMASLRTPAVLFAGSALIAALFAFGAYSRSQSDEVLARHLEHPQIGDVFVVELSKSSDKTFRYTYAAVVSVDDTKVMMAPARYQFQLPSGVREKDIKQIENYIGQVYPLDRSKLTKESMISVYPNAVVSKAIGFQAKEQELL